MVAEREELCLSRQDAHPDKDGRVAVPMLNPTDKELVMRPGQKVAYALPAFRELVDTTERLRDCLDERCKACNAKYKGGILHVK